MGHWILEVAKVAMYIGLPLSSFVYFNSPSFYMPVLYESRRINLPILQNDEKIRKQREIAAEVLRLQNQADAD